MLTKKCHTQKLCSWIHILQWKTQKDSDDFWHRKLTLKVRFCHFLIALHYSNLQNSMILFDYSWFSVQENFLLLYPSLENSTTGIAIPDNHTQGNNTSETQPHWIHPMDWKSFSFWIQVHLSLLEIWSAQRFFEAQFSSFWWGNIFPHVRFKLLVCTSFPTCTVPVCIFELSVPLFPHVQFHPNMHYLFLAHVWWKLHLINNNFIKINDQKIFSRLIRLG